jgi:nitroimidazol reductase NimA-like FMN-containing flavoprotein (pyridoxamine 5'-phosphate oxidase superfamily)
MHVRKMTTRECWSTLSAARLGRLACALEDQPYIVPISFVVDAESVYSFSMPGQKIEWLRSNPRACLQVDDIRSCERWTSVVARGLYEELSTSPAREEAHALLQRSALWWEPGAVPMEAAAAQAGDPIFYRLQVEELTGRIGTAA